MTDIGAAMLGDILKWGEGKNALLTATDVLARTHCHAKPCRWGELMKQHAEQGDSVRNSESRGNV